MTELWKKVPNFPGYEASSHGRIRRATACRGAPAGYEIKTPPDRLGYLKLALSNAGKVRHTQVHRVICETFHGPVPSGRHQAAHRNGVRSDCREENLYWATPEQQIADRVKHNLWSPKKGIEHHAAKVNDEMVKDIRLRWDNGESNNALAQEYGLSKGQISMIYNRKAWVHV